MKPILFNTDMVKAILEGKKTVTRRTMKPQPILDDSGMWHYKDCQWMDGGLGFPQSGIDDYAPYKPSNTLYVRETFGFGCTFSTEGHIFFKADGDTNDVYRWQPSIHMPKEAARIFLRVADVRVERLWESFGNGYGQAERFQHEGITLPEECATCIEAYGCPCCSDLDDSLPYDERTGEDSNGGSECGMLDEVRGDFAGLWDSTIKHVDLNRYGWAANPWVWVISFERCEKPKEEK